MAHMLLILLMDLPLLLVVNGELGISVTVKGSPFTSKSFPKGLTITAVFIGVETKSLFAIGALFGAPTVSTTITVI